MSVVSAMISKLTTLGTVEGFVPYFGEAAVRDSAGSVVAVGSFVVLEDQGTRIEYEMEYEGLEVTTLTVTVYGVTLAGVDQWVRQIKYGEDEPKTLSGLDFGTLTGLGLYLTFVECRRVNEVRSREHLSYSSAAQIVHKCVLTYEVTARISENL